MRRCGFIFSLDAFVAFTLIVITISLLIFTISTPRPFYSSLEQAHQLAYDTLQVLATSSDTAGGQTYLEQIISSGNGGATPGIMQKVVGGNATSRTIIPYGYGYRLRAYDFSNGSWSMLFETNGTACATIARCDRKYNKLQVSASTFVSVYEFAPDHGASPYCYLNCDGGGISPCTATPCDKPKSSFYPGKNSVQLVELIIFA